MHTSIQDSAEKLLLTARTMKLTTEVKKRQSTDSKNEMSELPSKDFKTYTINTSTSTYKSFWNKGQQEKVPPKKKKLLLWKLELKNKVTKIKNPLDAFKRRTTRYEKREPCLQIEHRGQQQQEQQRGQSEQHSGDSGGGVCITGFRGEERERG